MLATIILSTWVILAQEAVGADQNATKIIIGAFSGATGAGISAYAAYLVFNKLLAQVDKKDQVYENRIRALEGEYTRLSSEVKSLNESMISVQRDVLHKAIDIMEDTKKALERNEGVFLRLTEKLTQEE